MLDQQQNLRVSINIVIYRQKKLPFPGRILITPLGNPARTDNSANLRAVNGVAFVLEKIVNINFLTK